MRLICFSFWALSVVSISAAEPLRFSNIALVVEDPADQDAITLPAPVQVAVRPSTVPVTEAVLVSKVAISAPTPAVPTQPAQNPVPAAALLVQPAQAPVQLSLTKPPVGPFNPPPPPPLVDSTRIERALPVDAPVEVQTPESQQPTYFTSKESTALLDAVYPASFRFLQPVLAEQW